MGPGTVLAGLIKKIDRSVKVVSLEDPGGLPLVESLPVSEA